MSHVDLLCVCAVQVRNNLEPPFDRLFRIVIPTENGFSDSVHALQVRVSVLVCADGPVGSVFTNGLAGRRRGFKAQK